MNKLNKLAFAIFGNYVRKNKESFASLRSSIRLGHLGIPWDIYVCCAFLYASIIGMIAAILGLCLTPLWRIIYSKYVTTILKTGPDLGNQGELLFIFLIVIFISLFLGILSYFSIITYPGLIANIRKSKIEMTLPHAVAFMHAMSKGGMNLISIFKSLGQQSYIYGEFAEEIEYIVMESEMHGNDIISSLKIASANTNSDKFRDFLDNLITVSETSGDLETFFGNMVTYYKSIAESDQGLYLEMLGMLAETYITAFVAGPLFLITIVIVMGLMGPGKLIILKILIYAVIPLSAAAFSVLLSIMSLGGDSKLVKIYSVSKSINHYDDVRTAVSKSDERNISKLKRSLRWTSINQARKNPLQIFFSDPEKAFLITIPAAMIYFSVSIYSKKITIELLDDVIIISLLIAILPFLIFYEFQRRRILAIEESIPMFLKRMASINDVGMGLSDAIKSITKINLGVLSTEVKMMHKDIVWSNNVTSALAKFERRVRTISISRIVTLIIKASESTGNIKETLRVASNEADLAERLRIQKFTVLFSYLIVVYISFAVFILVLYVFATMFLPRIPDVATSGGSSLLKISSQKDEYNLLFMHAAVIQGFFSGIIAGQMMGESVYDGLKHSMIMVILAYVLFIYFI
jgi:flagellar protein FlaJ